MNPPNGPPYGWPAAAAFQQAPGGNFVPPVQQPIPGISPQFPYQFAPAQPVSVCHAQDDDLTEEMRTPSEEKDQLVAGALAYRSRGTPREQALERLKGALEMSAIQWMRYYLLRADEIDALVQPARAVIPLRRDSPRTSSSEASSDNSGGSAGSISPRRSTARQSSSPEAAPIARRSPRSPTSTRKRYRDDSDTEDYRSNRRSSGSGSVGRSGETVTDEHLDWMAEWQKSHGAGWVDDPVMIPTRRERWIPFEKKHPGIRSWDAWSNAYRRYKPQIAKRINALQVTDADERGAGQSKTDE